jgi:uncharacterized protein (TIGR02265 family)
VGELARRQVGEGGRLMETYRYPVAWMLGILDIIGQAAETGGEPYGEGLYRVGWDAGFAYAQSTVGRLRTLVATTAGLHRALEGVPNAASMAVNFGEHAYRRLSPNSGELIFQQDLIGLAWNTGMVVGSISAAFSLDPDTLKLECIPTDEDASSFILRLNW